MKNAKLLSILTIILFTSSVSYNILMGATYYELITKPDSSLKVDLNSVLSAPGSFNTDLLQNVSYNEAIKKDRRFKWKVTNFERTENFHIIEGDKRIKSGDKIVILIGTNPELQLTEVNDWCLIYINDVMARYPTDDLHVAAAYKYFLPLELNFTADGINYQVSDYFEYLETSPDVNQTIWSFDEDTVTYSDVFITQISNRTELEIIYDRESGFMNEFRYSSTYTSFQNDTTTLEGANMTLIRIHGFGLRYNITTWVVWIPVLLSVIGIILAIRFRVFQRFKIYREARKLAQRE